MQKKENKQKTKNKMAHLNPNVLIIALNVKYTNTRKRQILAEWIKIHGLTIYCLQQSHFKCNDIDRLKRKGQKKVYYANLNQKKAGAAVFISDKVDLRTKKITRHRKGHYTMTKGSNHQEDTAILNVYSLNNEL